ncbi:hypothetical protein BV898_11811 [Hypsibius exemplaris]|uniref:Uncharacterized protein n=1 Tax=Hypsibius exemplaris TaxID=2072580 RepID=A0A1W0WFG2_HYPEX|nr:hypothetical protein BV898_11811 [Hypsibius exemplaris]
MTRTSPDNIRPVRSHRAVYHTPQNLQLSQSFTLSLSRSTNFTVEEINQAGSDYAWWRVAQHGEALEPGDPEVYTKASHLLNVMTGLSIPGFVVSILKTWYQRCHGKQLIHLQQTIELDLIKKVEVMRRMASSDGSRRELSLLIGEVIAAFYKLFHDAVTNIPDEEVQLSMTNMSTWKSPMQEECPVGVRVSSSGEELRSPSLFPAGTDLPPSLKNWEGNMNDAEVSPHETALIPDAVPFARTFFNQRLPSGEWTPIEKPHADAAIEIQFTLHGVMNHRDGKSSLYPVPSRLDVMQEPATDSGEYGGQGQKKHWKRLRSVGEKFQRVFMGKK